jgi:hypothetical protein
MSQLHQSGPRSCSPWRHVLPVQGRSQRGPAVVCAREPPRMRNLRGGGGSTAPSPQYGSLNGTPTAPGDHCLAAHGGHPCASMASPDVVRNKSFLIPGPFCLRRQCSTHFGTDDVPRQLERTQQQHGG